MITSGRREKREAGGDGAVLKEVGTRQTEAESFSLRHSRHCKTTTTLDISSPLIFLSLILCLTEDWNGDGFIVP